MENNAHTLILIVGRTGSGKSSLVNKVCERTGLKQLISHTTRPRRNNEDNDHIFVTKEDYFEAKASGNIVAETEIAGNYYYATKEQLYEADFYTIDPQGIEVLLSMNLPNIRFVTVYISCPDALRETRAVDSRGDNKVTYRTRDFAERAQFRKFVADEKWDYSIKNINFAKSYSVLRWISTIECPWTQSDMERKDVE